MERGSPPYPLTEPHSKPATPSYCWLLPSVHHQQALHEHRQDPLLAPSARWRCSVLLKHATARSHHTNPAGRVALSGGSGRRRDRPARGPTASKQARVNPEGPSPRAAGTWWVAMATPSDALGAGGSFSATLERILNKRSCIYSALYETLPGAPYRRQDSHLRLCWWEGRLPVPRGPPGSQVSHHHPCSPEDATWPGE